jgi:lipoprotein-anchoring transpeptidase ErfK/SrfK
VIDLDQQRAYFYKGDQIVGVSIVSTGREGYDTPPGEFRITEKDPRPRGTIFRGAAMPYFLRIHGGIGMHAGYLPGYPASHGCIRLPEKMAVQFFKSAAVGTTVEIRHAVTPNYEPSPISERYSDFSSLLYR